MWSLLASVALGQSAIQPSEEGSELLADCVADPSCGAYIATQVSENLVEAGFAMTHAPMAASALGAKGMGLLAEVRVDSLPLGERNEVGENLKLPPVVPRLSAAYHVGSYTYDDPYPQYAIAAHVLPPVGSASGRGWSLGATGSVAAPLSELLWLGAEVDYTYGAVSATVLGTPSQLRQYEEVKPYLRGSDLQVQCDPCVDRVGQHAAGLRAGASIEPHPLAFAFVRGGVLLVHQQLRLDVDSSRWTLGGLLPTVGAGGGLRIADRTQVGLGASAAWKGEAVTTTRRLMLKLVGSLSVRFGDARYREQPR
jgi:hypothetical protein